MKEEFIEEKLLNNRTLIINSEINNISAMKLIKELLYLDSLNSDDITIYINSLGGSVTDGLAIIDTFNTVKSDIITVCVGMCASMAAIILSSGTKGKRLILPNATVMIHQPYAGIEGRAADIEIEASRISDVKNKLIDILAKNTKKNTLQVKNDIERNYYMNALEAKKYGIVDKKIGV